MTVPLLNSCYFPGFTKEQPGCEGVSHTQDWQIPISCASEGLIILQMTRTCGGEGGRLPSIDFSHIPSSLPVSSWHRADRGLFFREAVELEMGSRVLLLFSV